MKLLLESFTISCLLVVSTVALVSPVPELRPSFHIRSDASPTKGNAENLRWRRSTQLGSSSSEIDSLTSASTCDVLVLGAGPTGRAISSLLQKKGLAVTIADANYDSPFIPNYGVWQDEWEAVVERYAKMNVALEGGKCGSSLDRIWEYADCFFGGSFGKPMTERMTLDRPYCRVDRFALKESLTNQKDIQVIKANHIAKAMAPNIYNPTGSVVHDAEGTTIVLKSREGEFTKVRSKLVIDATGHESTLILRDTRAAGAAPPGYQIAYGCLVSVNEQIENNMLTFGPYDKEAMTLFDYRTDHFTTKEEEEKAIKDPTFMYVMPLEKNRVFFEETSLVARPAMSFQECKERCFQRLKYLGINVEDIEEEEFCYIPMGGALPIKDQRVVALGGAAAMVHPSTGYHLCRMLMGAADVADAVARELVDNAQPDLNQVAAEAYHAIWTPEAIRQRNFAVFGGEFLMKQDVIGLRGFFDGFFRLSLPQWSGFLAGWKGLPNNDQHESWLSRMWFGLNFIRRLPLPVAWDMFTNIVMYSLAEGAPLPQSVTPFLGEPQSYQRKSFLYTGDMVAKQEAKNMILKQESVTEQVPVAFLEEGEALPIKQVVKKEKIEVTESVPNVVTTTESTETADAAILDVDDAVDSVSALISSSSAKEAQMDKMLEEMQHILDEAKEAAKEIMEVEDEVMEAAAEIREIEQEVEDAAEEIRMVEEEIMESAQEYMPPIIVRRGSDDETLQTS